MRQDQEREFDEQVLEINRVSKKTKGGNTMRFNALVVVGDRKGRVGAAIAKAEDVRGAIQKAVKHAKRDMLTVPMKDTTIPYSVNAKFNAAKVMLKPAPKGSGIIAGGAVRIVLEAAGVKDAVGKILGSSNKTTNVYATLEALEKLKSLEERKGAKNGK